MRVNIMVGGADLNWIAGRLARELVERLPHYGIQAAINAPNYTDLEYQQIVYGPPTRRPAVGLFTHDSARATINTPYYDGHITLNPRIAKVCGRAGAKRPIVIEQAVDDCFLPSRPPVFGVAGSTKAGGRKGEALVAAMVQAGYTVRAWGRGWPCTTVGDQYSQLPAFYKSLDYYVVTSHDEGGCTPIIECMAMNIPVISPRIGFAIVRPVLEYEAGDWESLNTVLMYLTQHRTYQDWAHDHADYFREVLGA